MCISVENETSARFHKKIKKICASLIYTYLCSKLLKMYSVDHIRNDLIDRIMTITSEEYLIALNELVSVSSSGSEVFQLTKEQELMLQMSNADIKRGKMISQEDLKIKTKEWQSLFGKELNL